MLRADNLTTLMCRRLEIWEPQLPRNLRVGNIPVQELVQLYVVCGVLCGTSELVLGPWSLKYSFVESRRQSSGEVQNVDQTTFVTIYKAMHA